MKQILSHIDATLETSLQRLFSLLRIPSISAQRCNGRQKVHVAIADKRQAIRNARLAPLG